MQYYGAFYRSALYPLLQRINAYLMRWIRKKYERLRAINKAKASWRRRHRHVPGAVRPLGLDSRSASGDQDDKSRMNREVHVRICGGRGLCPEFGRTEGSSG